MKTKTSFRKGRPNPDLQKVKEWFGGLPVVEAKHELRIQPSAADLARSIRNDAQRCVFSQCARRMWGASKVVFFGSMAYVDLLDERGNRRVERFRIGYAGRRLIKDFDMGKKVKLSGFLLKPPSEGMTRKSRRDYMNSYNKKRRAKGLSTRPLHPGKYAKRRPAWTRFVEFERKIGHKQQEART